MDFHFGMSHSSPHSQAQLSGINKLSDMILQIILHKVDTHYLIRLRSVSIRWKEAIEFICSEKKCLMILNSRDVSYLSGLLTRFNGRLKLSAGFVFIQLNYIAPAKHEIHLSGDICTLLTKLFPRIEQFYVIEDFDYASTSGLNEMLRHWSASLTTLALRNMKSEGVDHLCAQINDLPNLKQLDLCQVDSRATLLAPTLSRIEHFSCWTIPSTTNILSYLSGECTSFSLLDTIFTKDKLIFADRLQEHAQFVSGLVCLSLSTYRSTELPFIFKHFSSLQMLRIDVGHCKLLTTEMIRHLAQLSHLTELQIEGIQIDLDDLLENVENLVSLVNIKKLFLLDFSLLNTEQDCDYDSMHPDFDVLQLCQVLSTIFPSVERLIIKCEEYYRELGYRFEAHLYLFANLYPHNFVMIDPFGDLLVV